MPTDKITTVRTFSRKEVVEALGLNNENVEVSVQTEIGEEFRSFDDDDVLVVEWEEHK